MKIQSNFKYFLQLCVFYNLVEKHLKPLEDTTLNLIVL